MKVLAAPFGGVFAGVAIEYGIEALAANGIKVDYE